MFRFHIMLTLFMLRFFVAENAAFRPNRIYDNSVATRNNACRNKKYRYRNESHINLPLPRFEEVYPAL